MPLTGFEIGDGELEITSTACLLDTGTSYIMLPEKDFSQFRLYLEADRSCVLKGGQFYCWCF